MSLHRFAALLRAEGHLAGRVMLNQLGVLSPAPDFLRVESWHVALSDDDSDACEIELAGVTSSLDATVLRLLGAHLVEPEVRLITLEVDEEPATACGHCDATTEDLRRLGWKASEDEDGVEVWTCPECRAKQPDELAQAAAAFAAAECAEADDAAAEPF